MDANPLPHAPSRSCLLKLEGSGEIERSEAGGKGFFLNLLKGLGLSVPPTVVIPVNSPTTVVEEVAAWARQTFPGKEVWELAVRSSAVCEDSDAHSNAGRFLSLLGLQDAQTIRSAVARVQGSGPDMAVVVQPLIQPILAGVAFSMNPLTHMRCELSVSWTEGLADKLVSGETSGWHVMYREGKLEGDEWPISPQVLDEIRVAAHLIEDKVAGPVDLEWVVDADSKLWIVQARPAVLYESRVVNINSIENVDSLPPLVVRHPKLRLRRLALLRGVLMAPAEVEVRSRSALPRSGPPTFRDTCGTSVVLLHPERIKAKIVREFAPAEPYDAGRFERTCRRYKVRRYPKNADCMEAIHSVLGIGLESCWTSIVIVQAIWDALFTGIVRRSVDGYVIDVAQGHFVPKGVVPTSTIVLSSNLKILSATVRDQPVIYRFCEGHVVTEEATGAYDLPESDLAAMVASFEPIFAAYEDAALEFGMVRRGDHLAGYLIDVAESDTRGMDLGIDQIRSGVLSAGTGIGRLVHFGPEECQALDGHLHNRSVNGRVSEDDIIIVAKQASVDLLPYVAAPGVVGFIFEHGAVLAHLAVVLREKGIPAISLGDSASFAKIPKDVLAELDASSAMPNAKSRINFL